MSGHEQTDDVVDVAADLVTVVKRVRDAYNKGFKDGAAAHAAMIAGRHLRVTTTDSSGESA